VRATPYLAFSGLRQLPVIRQAGVTECGLACIAMIASYFGGNADLVELRRRHGISLKGATLTTIMHICEALRITTRPVSCKAAELRQLRTPCILHWEFNHFVVLCKVRRDCVLLHDPARGRVREPLAVVRRAFTGVALELLPGTGFRQKPPARQLRLADLCRFDRGFLKTATVALTLALVCELLLLVTPFYLQLVIDQVLMRGDRALLSTLAAGFGLLVLFQVVANVMRQLTFQYLGQTAAFDMSSRVLHRLLRLPLAYYRSRELGDIQHRVQSLGRIDAFVTQSAPALLLDLVFLVLVSVMLVIYDAQLAALVILVAFLYCGWRALTFQAWLHTSQKLARAEASVQTHMLESLRGAQSIKMACGEARRAAAWRNRLAEKINAQIGLGNLAIGDQAVHQLAFQGLRVVVVFLLARDVLAGGASIGMVSAFIAWLGMFVTRLGGVVQRLIDYRLLAVPLGRVADIVFNEVEACAGDDARTALFNGSVTIRRLGFAYAQSEAAVVRDCTFAVCSGEFVAIRGCSGSGKSTLLRLLAGLESPSSGEILYDGRPARDWRGGRLRHHVATVFQDDALLAGSIAENIALLDERCDLARVRRVAELAAIDGEIEALPMRYETRIGDLGVALSTGQVQRILFARALYRAPRLLLLDEFTSGLDANTERRVVDTLRRLTVTRIVVTHSDVVMRAADRILEFRDGSVSPGRLAAAPSRSADSGHAAASVG